MIKLYIAILFVFQSQLAWAGVFNSDSNKFSENDSNTVSKLIDAFSSGCSLTGGVSSDALAVVRSLSDVMQSVANDPNCRSIVGAVSSLQASHLKATSIWPSANEEAYNEAQRDYFQLKKQKEQILLLIASETSLSVRETLQAQFRDVQIKLAGSDGISISALEADRHSRKQEAIRILVSSANLAIGQAIANQQCWIDKPDYLQQMVGLGSAVGYSAATVAPTSSVALALGAGLQFVGGFWDYVKRLSVDKKVTNFSSSLDPVALTCALEKMNHVYCSAKDAQVTLEILASKSGLLNKNLIWEGVRLEKKDLPLLLDWLNKLKSGAGSVSSPEDADKLNRFELKRQEAEQSPRTFQGFLGKYRPIFQLANDQETRFGILRDFISDTSRTLCPTYNGELQTSNPLCKAYSYDFIPFYLLGLTRDEVLTLKSKYTSLTFSQLDLQLLQKENLLVDVDIDQVEPRFTSWLLIAKQRLEVEASTIVGEDLNLVFEEALPRDSSELIRQSPYSAAEKVLRYLQSGIVMASSSSFEPEVILALSEIIASLDDLKSGKITHKIARDKIITAANLNSGVTFFQNRLRFALRQQIETYLLQQGDPSLQALAANDYVQELYSYYRADSLEIIRRKSLTAQATIQRSIDPFISFFAVPLRDSLNSFDSLAKKYKEGPGGPNYEMKMTLCFYLLAASQWEIGIDLSPCIGVQGKPMLINGFSTAVFSKALFSLPYSERACILRDYNRRNQVLQMRLGIAKKKKTPAFK